MSYTCKIYINSSANNYSDKVLTGETDVTCEFKAPIDIVNPTIYISATDAYTGYNYLYIPDFGRYYYAKCIGGTSQTLTFECKSDPIMSFRTGILAAPAVIARNPWKYDKYIHDPKLPLESRTVRATYLCPSTTRGTFQGSNNKYILTTIGSGGSGS